MIVAAAAASPIDGTVLAAIVTVIGTVCVTFLTIRVGSRTNEVAKRANSHDELRNVITEVREQADRADQRAERAERRADDAMEATRACEEREHNLRSEMEQDRRLMTSMQRRLSRLDGEPDYSEGTRQ